MNHARIKHGRKLSAAALALALSATIAGCSSAAEGDDAVAESNAPTVTAAPSVPEALDSDLASSGTMVENHRGSYEKLALDPYKEVFQYNNGNGHPAELEAVGILESEGQWGQIISANFIVEEYLDSEAVNGGIEGYARWYNGPAPTVYLHESIKEKAATSESGLLLGNFTEAVVPGLIQDGKQRAKAATLDLVKISTVPSTVPGELAEAVTYTFDLDVAFRVDSGSAIQFIAKKYNMTPEEYRESKASDAIKGDSTDENEYRGSGTIDVTVARDSDGQMRIAGFEKNVSFNASNFEK